MSPESVPPHLAVALTLSPSPRHPKLVTLTASHLPRCPHLIILSSSSHHPHSVDYTSSPAVWQHMHCKETHTHTYLQLGPLNIPPHPFRLTTPITHTLGSFAEQVSGQVSAQGVGECQRESEEECQRIWPWIQSGRQEGVRAQHNERGRSVANFASERHYCAAIV